MTARNHISGIPDLHTAKLAIEAAIADELRTTAGAWRWDIIAVGGVSDWILRLVRQGDPYARDLMVRPDDQNPTAIRRIIRRAVSSDPPSPA